jgi:hypothetical protein
VFLLSLVRVAVPAALSREAGTAALLVRARLRAEPRAKSEMSYDAAA